jgi:membrane-associated protein
MIDLSHLAVASPASYLVAFLLPALDAILPVLPSETAVIALGVATAGGTDPRIVVLVVLAACGAFAGDNLAYLIGRRFGPAAQRRFLAGERGRRRLAWAAGALDRFGFWIIIACRFIPGGRTAVTLSCGLIGYRRRTFVAATACAAAIWAAYAFFIGRLGGKAFEDRPWAGFLLAFAAAAVISVIVEAVRRIWARRRRSRGHAGQVEADDPGEHEADRHELGGRHRVAEQDHAHDRRPGGADPRPDRVGGPDLELTQRDR